MDVNQTWSAELLNSFHSSRDYYTFISHLLDVLISLCLLDLIGDSIPNN